MIRDSSLLATIAAFIVNCIVVLGVFVISASYIAIVVLVVVISRWYLLMRVVFARD
jgi:hypothetical protein